MEGNSRVRSLKVGGMKLEDKISVKRSWKAENFEGEKAAEVDGGMKSQDEINIESHRSRKSSSEARQKNANVDEIMNEWACVTRQAAFQVDQTEVAVSNEEVKWVSNESDGE